MRNCQLHASANWKFFICSVITYSLLTMLNASFLSVLLLSQLFFALYLLPFTFYLPYQGLNFLFSVFHLHLNWFSFLFFSFLDICCLLTQTPYPLPSLFFWSLIYQLLLPWYCLLTCCSFCHLISILYWFAFFLWKIQSWISISIYLLE